MTKPAHCPDAEWFLRHGASLGERGTSEALLHVLMYGPSGTPSPDHLPFGDTELGWGPPPRREGDVARARRCWKVWRALTPLAQEVLAARYGARQWPPGVSGALGDLAGVVVVLVGSAQARKRIYEARARLAELEGLPWSPVVAEIEASAQRGLLRCDWEGVIGACQSLSMEALKQRGKWLTNARKAVAAAVEEWGEAAKARAAEVRPVMRPESIGLVLENLEAA